MLKPWILKYAFIRRIYAVTVPVSGLLLPHLDADPSTKKQLNEYHRVHVRWEEWAVEFAVEKEVGWDLNVKAEEWLGEAYEDDGYEEAAWNELVRKEIFVY